MSGAYNAKIIHEQGASVMTVQSAGSITIDSGGKVVLNGVLGVQTGGSIAIDSGGKIALGGIELLFGTIIEAPTVEGTPGSFFMRGDGSASNFYINTSDGTAGSVWAPASINRP